MSLSIGGMSNPLLKPTGINPFNKTQSKQNNNLEDQVGQTKDSSASKPANDKTPEKTDEELKKYSQCMTSYAKAMLAMQGSSNSGSIGVETSGSVG